MDKITKGREEQWTNEEEKNNFLEVVNYAH